MAFIKPKNFLFDTPDDMTDVVGFNVYYCTDAAGPITYATAYKFFPLAIGQVTYNIALPADLPVSSGDMILGVATVDESGNFSDIETLEYFFKFTPPNPPKNLRVL